MSRVPSCVCSALCAIFVANDPGELNEAPLPRAGDVPGGLQIGPLAEDRYQRVRKSKSGSFLLRIFWSAYWDLKE
ncbi:hypothetical protein BJX61DRAFT_524122 [Aspergillus egyptiacus]|nr:hypothetical protein BJX61DRAFT_524122 [Aspergillus egyptiacus]